MLSIHEWQSRAVLIKHNDEGKKKKKEKAIYFIVLVDEKDAFRLFVLCLISIPVLLVIFSI